MKTWSEVVNSDAFKGLSAQDRYKARAEYFSSVIAPKVPEPQRAAAKDEFYTSTDDAIFSTADNAGMAAVDMARIMGNAATFNLMDKGVAGLRAITEDNLDYGQALEQERAETGRSRERAGWAGTAGDVIGGALLGGGLARKGLSAIGSQAAQRGGLLTKTLAGAADGAAMGAGYAVGGADAGLDLVDNLTAAGTGAALGGAVGGAAAPLATGAARLLQALGITRSPNAILPDGTEIKGGPARLADKALRGERGAQAMQQMDDLGRDAMLLNASPDMKGGALGVVAKGGAPGEMVEQALEKQMAGRSDRLFSGLDDALGPVGRDARLIDEGLKETLGDLRVEYGKALKGTKVPHDLRRQITIAAHKASRNVAASSPVREHLAKYADIGNLPENAVQLRNLKNDIDSTLKRYPGSETHFYRIKEAIDEALTKATGGSGGTYATLQKKFATTKGSMEAAERAYKFLDPAGGKDRVYPRDIRADMAKNAADAPLMREVARGSVDDLMRNRSNEISTIQNQIGRTANSTNRENIAAVFGPQARDKLANTVEAEVGKSRDFAEIVRNSNTARKQAAMQEIDANEWMDLVPENRSGGGIIRELSSLALKKIKEIWGGRATEASRELVARMVTMDKQQLQQLILELDKAAAARAQRGVGSAAAVGGAVSAGRYGR